MVLFYTPDINAENYILNEDDSNHCIKVLRLKIGEKVTLTNGKGCFFHSIISDAHSRHCQVKVENVEVVNNPRTYKLHIAIAPTKNIARFEWFLEKATEMGIDEITPLICEHSERHSVNFERLSRIVTSAVKQSLSAFHPRLGEAVSFREFIERKFDADRFIAYCSVENSVLLQHSYRRGSNAVILIGPEGDFSSKEVLASQKAGFLPVSLGNSRLRTETAALFACASIHCTNLMQ
ncbi:MAG: 16S rRNA (uracil(1498)-N(3))-methyltransferase [Lentimicrobiaceae bacterium]|nr:16S rRNA (uracil(1498)-N(3))-methyltransferase [Lentimicrobiaceae bacterium]